MQAAHDHFAEPRRAQHPAGDTMRIRTLAAAMTAAFAFHAASAADYHVSSSLGDDTEP